MRYLTLPNTDLQVSGICLGTATIGSQIDRRTSFRLLDMFVDQGGTFIDTASVYADWLPGPRSSSEKTIGEWLARSSKREQVVLGTKGGHPNLNTMHTSRMSRAEIIADLEASLRNLRTEQIDLYWLHRDDAERPAGEHIEVLEEQKQAGKIRWYGCSNWKPQRIIEAQSYAEALGYAGFVADQMRWSLALVVRSQVQDQSTVDMDDELFQLHQRTGLAAVPFSSQAGGLFQKMDASLIERTPSSSWAPYNCQENRGRFRRALEIAKRQEVSLSAVVLGYLQSQSSPTTPIVGCRSIEQLEDSLAGADLVLDKQEVAFLEGCGEFPG